ncbi:hypothetical protein [Streptomyces sp. NPDC005732]|uniref:hypothetical protein n=1 Tax=Streptomyces sp. NPDC005732 TaxID=3157057 RepID=UPI0033FA456C
MTTPTADEFPVRGARFVGGRTEHRTRMPVDQRWHQDQLEAACGKTGWLARGYTNGAVRPCAGCEAAVSQPTERAAA